LSQRPVRPAPAPVRAYRPEERATPDQYAPGDFILTHNNGFQARLIRIGQSLRFWGQDRKYTRWNHTAMIVSSDGDIIEALGDGVVMNHLDKYRSTEYQLVKIDEIVASAADRAQVIAFARWCLDESYDWLTIASIFLSLLTGCKFNFGFDGQCICSGLVARALERTNVIFERTPSHMTPADLAKKFSVEPPPEGTSKGTIPKN
jgi:hypothetical protein